MFSLRVNESNNGRRARITLGIFVVALGIALDGIWGLVLGVAGLVPLVSGLTGWCPFYALFKKISANRFTINLYRKRFKR